MSLDARAKLLVALERGGPLLSRFEASIEAGSLRAHAWALIEAWAAHGADPRHRWVLAGLRVVSDDELEERLVPAQDPDAVGAGALLERERDRLERALSSGRDWSVADWQHWIFGHPLVRRLLRGLIWTQPRAEGTQIVFAVDEEFQLRDLQDRPVALDPHQRVRLVHPTELDAATRAAWGDHLAEHEWIPPFPQLSRPTESAGRADLGADTLRGFPSGALARPRLRACLHRRGWAAGEPDERVRVRYFTRSFLNGAIHAVLVVSPGLGRLEQAQTLTEAFFLTARPGGMSFATASRLPLASVPPLARSEVHHDLAEIAEEASHE